MDQSFTTSTTNTTTVTTDRALRNSYKNLKHFINQLFTLSFDSLKRTVQAGQSLSENSRSYMNGANRKRKFKKALFAVLPILVVIIVITVIAQTFRSQPNVQSVSTASATNNGIVKSTDPISKVFTFPLVNEKDKKIGEFSYEIQGAELRKDIIVKGQKATAIDGRIFLIINLKIKNNLEQGLQINTRDYVRLMINNNHEDLLAADIHNDPVEVQAISTKYTRIGFAFDEKNSKDLTLIVGEINGDKQEINLKF